MSLSTHIFKHETLTQAELWHLLWRTGFGANLENFQGLKEVSTAEVIDHIVTIQPESESFQTTESLLRDVALDTQNIDDLKAWWLYRMQRTANPLCEKLALMWHNHFATSYAKVGSVTHMFNQNELIRSHTLGDFQRMLHGMSQDVAMLIWLDGNANRKRSPNENFSREVMELFSLGVGNYTEDDIKEAARAFTGWHVRNEEFWFNTLQHDTGHKTVLGKTGNLNGGDIVDLCLQQESCARFLALKLLRTFVTFDPTNEEVIAVSESVQTHNFKIAAVMSELLKSAIFWKPEYQHSLIKSPLEFVMGTYRALDAQPNYVNAGRLLKALGQDLFEPPTVKGWEGGRQWINSTSLIQRMNFATSLLTTDQVGRLDRLDDLNVSIKSDSPSITQNWCEFLLGNTLEASILQQLDQSIAGKSSEQTRQRIHYILTLPDYQLM